MKFTPLLFIAFVCGCAQQTNKFEINRLREVLVDDDKCDISYYYPQIVWGTRDYTLINKTLKLFSDCEYYAHNCDEKKPEKNIIRGDYQILLQEDSLVCVEYIKDIENYEGNRNDTVYNCIILNPKAEKDPKRFFLTQPEQMIPNFDRGILYPYVEKYSRTHNLNVNLLAYESKSNYTLTWGITKDKFIVYVGDEGEFFGHDKIQIPFTKLKIAR